MKPSRRPKPGWTLGGAGALMAGLALLIVPPAAGSDDPPVFPSQIEMVTVHAVIVDSDGKPVPDLTREDFAVLEGGVRQELATFEAISAPGGGESAAAPATLAARPVRVATNVTSPAQRATFLVVVDDIHLSAATAREARSTLARFLSESVRPGDRMTIVSTVTRAAWSGTLPEDRDDLLEFVGRLKGRLVKIQPELMTEYEAMRIARQHFTPDAGRPLLCQFEVFGAARSPATNRADVTVQLTLSDGQGRPIGAAAPASMTQSADGRLRQLIALPLDRLAAGPYALTLVVEDRVARAKDEWQDRFVVEAPPALAGGSALAPAPEARATAARMP